MPDFKFLVADILELAKLPETDFDYVFCVAVLHHLPSDNLRLKALEQMKNKLKPGGRLVITVWNLWAQNKFLKMIFKYGLLKLAGRNKMDFGDILFNWQDNQGKSLSRRYYHAFTGAGLKKLAQTVGFYIENICHDQYNYYLILKK